MTYVAREAQQQLLDTVAEAAHEVATAVAALGAAYEQLDDDSADRLEQRLFRPVQAAYGRVQRAHAGFGARHDLPAATFGPASAGLPSRTARDLVEAAVAAVGEADFIISELQDSMMPVEVGDAELRADLAAIRELIGALPERARELLRTLGR